MLKRIFAGIVGLALAVTLIGFIGSKLTLVAVGASPLPSGCYTDGFGLAVCGPNYAGPGGGSANIVAGTCISITPTAVPTAAQVVAVSGTGCTPPPFPLSIANGGTGTAAPAPTGTNGCTVGTFPSLLVSCPTAAPGYTPSPVPNNQLMANISGGSATPVPVGLSAIIDAILGNTQGNILYRGSSAWSVLAPGTSGQYLETLGSAANPQWSSPPTSAPASTLCPSPGAGITVTGTYPCTIAASIAPSSCPACYFKGSSQSWLAYVATISSVTHIWPMSDSAGCNNIADVVATYPGATAAPSTVNLATPTTNPSPDVCGAPSISNDGNTSVQAEGTSNGSYFTMPSGTPAPSTNWSLCGAVKVSESSFLPLGSSHWIIWAFETNGSLLNYDYFSSGTVILNANGVNQSVIYDPGNSSEYHCITVNGSTNVVSFYINGTFVGTVTPGASVDAAKGLVIGNGNILGGQNWPYAGRECCFVIGNAIWTQAQIEAMTAALGY